MKFCLRPKELNLSHYGESALNHTFKMLLRKVLSFWSLVKPFLTNKSFHTQNDIMLIDNGKVIVEENDLVETFNDHYINIIRSSRPEVFLRKGALKICSKFTGEHPCRSVISIKLLCNFIEIALRHGCFPVNLLHIFRTPLLKNISGWLLLYS